MGCPSSLNYFVPLSIIVLIDISYPSIDLKVHMNFYIITYPLSSKGIHFERLLNHKSVKVLQKGTHGVSTHAPQGPTLKKVRFLYSVYSKQI